MSGDLSKDGHHQDISLLVTSCSLYKNIWTPFFSCLKEYWSDCPYKIYLGTDKYTDDYTHENHDINLIKTDIEPYADNYTDRIADFLKQINTKYVLLCQEDHVIDAEVHTQEILECYNILEDNQEQYKGVRLHGVGCDCGQGKYRFNVNNRINLNDCSVAQKYWFSFMFTLWNTKFVSSILDNFSGNTQDCETRLTDKMKTDNHKILSIAQEYEAEKRIKNIIPYKGIGAINGGIVEQTYMDFFKEKNIPMDVYDQNCIYDKRGDEQKFNKDDEYYMRCQTLSGSRAEKEKNDR
jgi:hypothetical protein